MKKFFAIFFLAALLYSCANQNISDGRLKVAVSIPPEIFVVNAIAADSVNIYCVMDKGNNPESKANITVTFLQEFREKSTGLSCGV